MTTKRFTRVMVEVTGRCNSACLFCTRADPPKFPDVDYATFKQYMTPYPDEIEALTIHSHGGEVTVNTAYADMARIGLRHGSVVELTTNGQLLNNMPVSIWSEGKWSIKVSVDAADRWVYEWHRRGSSWSALLEGMLVVGNHVHEFAPPQPYIGLVCACTLSWFNFDSVHRIVELAARNRFQAFRIAFANWSKTTMPELGVHPNTPAALDALGRVQAACEKEGLELQDYISPFLNTPLYCPRHMTASGCSQARQMVWVWQDGAAGPCNNVLPRDLYGNAATESIAEMFHSTTADNHRMALDRGDRPVVCRKCSALVYRKAYAESQKT